jgi:hypothetical protein
MAGSFTMSWHAVKPTNSIEHGPWGANIFSCSQEISRILWNPKLYYCVQNSRPLVPIISQINALHILPSYLFKTCYNLSSLLWLGLQRGFFPSGFAAKNLYVSLSSPIRATCHVQLILLDLINRVIFGETCKSWSCTLCRLFRPPFVPLY